VFPVLVVLWLLVMWLLDVVDMVAACVSQAERAVSVRLEERKLRTYLGRIVLLIL